MISATTTRAQFAPRYLSRCDAAKYLGISTRLLDKLVSEKKLPVCRPSARRVVVDATALDEFMAGCKA